MFGFSPIFLWCGDIEKGLGLMFFDHQGVRIVSPFLGEEINSIVSLNAVTNETKNISKILTSPDKAQTNGICLGEVFFMQRQIK